MEEVKEIKAFDGTVEFLDREIRSSFLSLSLSFSSRYYSPPFPPPFPLPRNARIITHRCQNNLITSASTPMIDRVFHSLRTYPPPPLSSNDPSTLLLPSLRAKLAEVRYFEQEIFPRRNVVDNVSFVRLGTSRGDEWNFYSGLGRNIYFLA